MVDEEGVMKGRKVRTEAPVDYKPGLALVKSGDDPSRVESLESRCARVWGHVRRVAPKLVRFVKMGDCYIDLERVGSVSEDMQAWRDATFLEVEYLDRVKP